MLSLLPEASPAPPLPPTLKLFTLCARNNTLLLPATLNLQLTLARRRPTPTRQAPRWMLPQTCFFYFQQTVSWIPNQTQRHAVTPSSNEKKSP